MDYREVWNSQENCCCPWSQNSIFSFCPLHHLLPQQLRGGRWLWNPSDLLRKPLHFLYILGLRPYLPQEEQPFPSKGRLREIVLYSTILKKAFKTKMQYASNQRNILCLVSGHLILILSIFFKYLEQGPCQPQSAFQRESGIPLQWAIFSIAASQKGKSLWQEGKHKPPLAFLLPTPRTLQEGMPLGRNTQESVSTIHVAMVSAHWWKLDLYSLLTALIISYTLSNSAFSFSS